MEREYISVKDNKKCDMEQATELQMKGRGDYIERTPPTSIGDTISNFNNDILCMFGINNLTEQINKAGENSATLNINRPSQPTTTTTKSYLLDKFQNNTLTNDSTIKVCNSIRGKWTEAPPPPPAFPTDCTLM